MIRARRLLNNHSLSKPRASGDDPWLTTEKGISTLVNPARAGMIRFPIALAAVCTRKPRASGDDPIILGGATRSET